jgi:hypothetical protein
LPKLNGGAARYPCLDLFVLDDETDILDPLLQVMSYDRADFNYSSEDDPLPPGHAATHIGMFLAWSAQNGLINDFHEQHSAELLGKLRARQITGKQFFEAACKEHFAEKDLNVEGNAFAELYYRNLAGERGPYFVDYKKVLAAGLPSFWHVADTWENYDRIEQVITRRYGEWKNPRKKRWWQFWK